MNSRCGSFCSAETGIPHVPTHVHRDVQGCLKDMAKQTGTCRKPRYQCYMQLCFSGKAAIRSLSLSQPSRGASSITPLLTLPNRGTKASSPVPVADAARTFLSRALLFWLVFYGAAVGLGNLCILMEVCAVRRGRLPPDSCSSRRAPEAQLSR